MKNYVAALCFLLLIVGSARAQPRQQFKKAVDNIIGDPSDILRYGDFAYDPKFIKLANQKEKILQSCLNLISDPTASDAEKTFAIMLTNKISPENYAIFLDKIFVMYKRGILDENDLSTAILPEHPLIDVVTDNYKLPSERAVLSKMIKCNCLSKNLSHILFDILSGHQYRGMQDFYRNCCREYKFIFW